MSKESPVKVSLDLNEELREYAVKRLAQFRTGLLIIYQLTLRRIMNVLNMIIERIGLLILLVHSYSHGLIRL